MFKQEQQMYFKVTTKWRKVQIVPLLLGAQVVSGRNLF